MHGQMTLLAGLPGGWEWIIVLVIFLLLFGRRLPGVARSLGQGITSFKKGLNDPTDDVGHDDDSANAGSANDGKAIEKKSADDDAA